MYKVNKGLVPDNVPALLARKDSTYSLQNSDFVTPLSNSIRYCKHETDMQDLRYGLN